MNFYIINTFTGGIDTDSDDFTISPDDYRDAVNIRNGITYEGRFGSATNVKGNVAISYTLPAGNYKCIGSVHDAANKSIIYFIWADSGEHRILRYKYEPTRTQANGYIELLMTYYFGWDYKTFIQADVVDGKYLYWVDPKPRKLNIEKASLVDKKKSWKWYVPSSYTGETITFTVKDMTNAFLFNTVVSIGSGTRAATLSSIKWALEADSNFNSSFDIELCDDCSLLITEKYDLPLILFHDSGQGLLVPENWYGNTTFNLYYVNDRIFDRGKYPPVYQPSVQYKKDSNKNYNFVKNKVFQFRLQYHYDDNEESALSPISKIPDLASCAEYNLYNYIEINFNNTDLASAINLTILKQVSVLVREHNSGAWRKVVTLDVCEFYDSVSGGVKKMLYKFYNDISTTGISSVVENKQYDKVGIEIGASKFVKDRIIDGSIKDDYDVNHCIDMDVTAVIEPVTQKKMYKVSGRICIYSYGMDSSLNSTDLGSGNFLKLGGRAYSKPLYSELNGLVLYDSTKSSDDYYKYPHFGGGHFNTSGGFTTFDVNPNVMDSYDQRLPEGGFPVYVAGTDYFTISRQSNLGLNQNDLGAIDYSDASKKTEIKDFFKDTFTTSPTFRDTNKVGSYFELWLPEGTHIIRIGSHWCSFGDKLGKGKYYDLNQSLYQKTSTNVWGRFANDGVTWYGGEKEIKVTITNSDIDVGTFVVKDLTPANDESVKFTNFCGYLVDDVGRTDPNSSTFNPLSVELAYIGGLSMNDPDVGTSQYYEELDNAFTDHNGYFFIQFQEYFTDTSTEAFYLFASQVKSGASTGIHPAITQVTNVSGGAGATTIKTQINSQTTMIKDFESLFWIGTLTDLYDKTLTSFGYNNNGSGYPAQFYKHPTDRTYNVILTTDTADARNKCSTKVTGNVNKAEGITVVITNGGMTKTNSNGDYSLVIWGNTKDSFNSYNLWAGQNSARIYGLAKWNQLNQRTDDVVFVNNTQCDFSFSSDYLTCHISDFGANALVQTNTAPYSPTSVKLLGTVTATALSTTNIKGWKRGSSRYVGIRYYDQMNRSSSVLTNELCKVSIPFLTEKDGSNNYYTGRGKINVVINHQAPAWAKTFQILVTADNYYSNYVQWKINSVKEESGTLKLSLANFLLYQSKTKSTEVGYNYTPGDKIRIISTRDTYLQGLYEFDVIGSEDPNVIVISKPSFDIKSGYLVEIYSLKQQTEEKIFYEIGETYAANSGVHTVTNITLNGGDTYWRTRKIPVYDSGYVATIPTIVEDKSVSDFFSSNDKDYGRIGIEDSKYGRTHKKTLLRVSNPYVPNSRINGLSNNENVDDKELGINYIDIKRIVYVGDVALAICENKIVANYIGHVLAQSAQTGLLATTKEFIGDTRPLVEDWGTQHANSVSVRGAYVYGFDAKKGITWRYATNGLADIRVKTTSLFNAWKDKEIWSVCSGFDNAFQQYLLSIAEMGKEYHNYLEGTTLNNLLVELLDINGNASNLSVGDYVDLQVQDSEGVLTYAYGFVYSIGANINIALKSYLPVFDPNNVGEVRLFYAKNKNTYAWSESKNRWESRYSFTPEQMEGGDKIFTTFNKGVLYLHDKNNLFNNFFGTQYKTSIKFVANGAKYGKIVKLFNAITLYVSQVSGFNWSAPVIKNATQLSRLLVNKFVNKEGKWHSEFMRDINSTGGIMNGNDLRGIEMEITLENDSTGDVSLDQTKILVTESKKN